METSQTNVWAFGSVSLISINRCSVRASIATISCAGESLDNGLPVPGPTPVQNHITHSNPGEASTALRLSTNLPPSQVLKQVLTGSYECKRLISAFPRSVGGMNRILDDEMIPRSSDRQGAGRCKNVHRQHLTVREKHAPASSVCSLSRAIS